MPKWCGAYFDNRYLMGETVEVIKTKARDAIGILKTEIKNGSAFLYCIVLGIYQLSLFLENVQFAHFPGMTIEIGLSCVVLILLGIYLGSILVMSVKKRWAMIPVLALLVTFMFMCARMQRDKFDGLMIVILAICAYGKDYRKILRVMLCCAATTVAIAVIGLPIGFTVERPKVGLYGIGLAFGFAHPNVWGSYVFFVFVLVWYLFVRNADRKVRTGYLFFSWVLAVFMVLVPKCRTQALLLLLFPITIWLCRIITTASMEEKKNIPHKIVLCVLITFPFLCFFATIFLGSQREWLAVHTMGTYIENFTKRFIQGGLAFREHGFPIIGELIRYKSGLVENLGNHDYNLYVLDNAYVTYTIYRGLIWMIPALLWLSFANWKMIRKKDYSLLTISTLFCLMGLMERYTLEVYNFIFFYPLAVSAFPSDVISTGKEQISSVGKEASS